MNVQDFPHTTDDSAGQALIGAAAAALARRRHDIPDTFLAELLGSAVPDDLQRYGPDELAAIAERSWALLAARKAGAPKISFEPAPATRTVAVLDIINDDMPFLLDSVVGELNQRGLGIRLLVHPVFTVERDAAGTLVAFKGVAKGGGLRESFIHIHIEGVAEAARRAEIVRALEDILADVRVAVQDWRPMLDWLRAIIAELRANPPPLDAGEIAEAVQFLEWLAADNFTLLGARDYVFTGDTDVLEPMFETGLGLLRSRDVRPLQRWNQPLVITPEIRALMEEPRLLVITKSTLRSPVHRRVDMDYIGVKRFDRHGKLVGEFRLCGLFTSTAYTRSVRAIPYLRRKADDVIRRAGFDPASHSGKALVNVLETYPRDELFQIDEDLLYHFALAVLQLDERPRVRVLPRRDRFDRFVSVLVYMPRERYDGRIRALIGDYLATAFNGLCARLLSVLRRRPAGARALHHRPLRGRSAESRSRHARPRGRNNRAQLDRRIERGARRRLRAGQGAHAVGPLPRCVSDRLSRGLFAGDGRRRHSRRRTAHAGAAARRRSSIARAERGRRARG